MRVNAVDDDHDLLDPSRRYGVQRHGLRLRTGDRSPHHREETGREGSESDSLVPGGGAMGEAGNVSSGGQPSARTQLVSNGASNNAILGQLRIPTAISIFSMDIFS